ncbi:MAG: DUF4105 domain-containing protein [Deltaproteobacteria bacterium]|nr:DUF4105 domain-containing protein [Deltaproteobacteria bacterium]
MAALVAAATPIVAQGADPPTPSSASSAAPVASPPRSVAPLAASTRPTAPAASQGTRAASAAYDAANAQYQIAYVEWLVEKAKFLGLASKTQWLRLGHYQPRTFGGHKSEVDGAPFFLDPNGKFDPAAELEATVRGLFAANGAEGDEEHALCRFPARRIWLEQQLGIDTSRLPTKNCRRQTLHWNRLQAQSVTLVFSSYYLNNPASGYGHTFLRINRAPDPNSTKRPDLLNYGVDFSANVDTSNALIYAIKGFSGMFSGTFKLLPYFYKVREYNDYESRDLWEYELGLTPGQVRMLVAHLWELGQTFFQYFYLDENCSYHILALVEACSADYRLLEYLSNPVLPADTIKALHRNPGLVKSVRFRPSVRTQFRQRLAALSSAERDAVAALADDPDAPLPDTLTQEQKARVLDAALDQVDFRFAKDLIDEENAAQVTPGAVRKQRLEERRAEILVPTESLSDEPPWNRRPELSHPSTRLALASGASTHGAGYAEIGYRMNLHDLADPPRGYPEMAQIEFMPIKMRFWYQEHTVRVEDFSAVSVVSLAPQDRFDRRMTWHVRAGGTRIRDAGCNDCFMGLGQVGGGVAFGSDNEAFTFFTTIDTQLLSGPKLEGGLAGIPLRLGFGPWSGMRIRWSQKLVTLTTGRALWLPFQDPKVVWQGEGIVRWSLGEHAAIGVEGRAFPKAQEAQLASYLYF